jgi:ubiquinone biosynthesis protein UbiJ
MSCSAPLAICESTVNRLLALDLENARRLADVQGLVLLIDIKGLGIQVFIVPGIDSVQLFNTYAAEPDCTIRGTPATLIEAVMSSNGTSQVFAGQLEIIGDNYIAQRLFAVIHSLNIDWETVLNPLLGEQVSSKLSHSVQNTQARVKQSCHSFLTTVRHYLVNQEHGVLPDDTELTMFLNHVDQLRDDIERLSVRIDHLETTADNSKNCVHDT